MTMTVGFSAISMVSDGCLEQAIKESKKSSEILASLGAQNVRTMLLQNSTPLRLVTTFEADSQAALGAVLDAWAAHPSAHEAQSNVSAGGPLSGYMTETWTEL